MSDQAALGFPVWRNVSCHGGGDEIMSRGASESERER